MLAHRTNMADFLTIDSFPEYVDPLEDTLTMATESAKPKPLAQIQSEESSRGPSPQPTHFSVPLPPYQNSNGHRILRSATVGYIAPEFQGKEEQMEAGKSTMQTQFHLIRADAMLSSQGHHSASWMDPGEPNRSTGSLVLRATWYRRCLLPNRDTRCHCDAGHLPIRCQGCRLCSRGQAGRDPLGHGG